MTLSVFRQWLDAHPKRPLRFILPDGGLVPVNFHVTEVGHVRKEFLDCGGQARSVASCQLQTWVSETDPDHRITADKLASILERAKAILSGPELPVEVEHEDCLVSQFPVIEVLPDPEFLAFRLGSKHTDCLAREICLAPAAITSDGKMENSGEPCGCGPSGCC